MATLPLIMSNQGLQPQAPADIRQQILDAVAATNDDYTANLPASLIEDVLSTEVAGVVQSDSFLVDLVNSISPNGANPFLLALFGQLYDVPVAVPTNTSVYLVFTGPPGFVIVKGFTVSDGGYFYICQEGGIIGADHESLPIYALATISGNWAVPAGSVNILNTSVPAEIIAAGFSVTNPEDGIPSITGESIASYRERIFTASLASTTGMARYMKTILARVPGVQQRLVSARQVISSNPLTNGRYIALVGAGDPYQVAYALASAMFWVAGFVEPQIEIINIVPGTWMNPVDQTVHPITIITTEENHNLLTGMQETIVGVNGTGALGPTVLGTITDPHLNPYTITYIDPKNFWIMFDSSTYGTSYLGGGTVTPNPIVEEVTITDYPDTYLVSYVIPPQESVQITVTWRTDSPNYVSSVAVAQVVAPAISEYINGLAVGVTPINIYDMTQLFLNVTADIVPNENVTFLNFDIVVDDFDITPPNDAATGKPLGVIYGDPNSYFFADVTDIIVTEG